ncbi:MAG TPA: hypothetical protein VKR79_00140 [Gaiellaceae bacterium]|nr:hypothetical protein [Gaiellaceae bacterium]
MLADVLTRDTSHAVTAALAPSAGLGVLLLIAALAGWEKALAWALFVGGAAYVGAVVASGHDVDSDAPLIAVLLFLAGELGAWSLAERWRIRADEALAWRRAVVLGGLALAGLVAATIVVGLSAVRPGHGLVWTAAGAVAAVAAVGAGGWLARR